MSTIEYSDYIYCPCGYQSKKHGEKDGYGIQGNLYICPACKSISYINIHKLQGNTYIKYYLFTSSTEDFKKQCLEYLRYRVNTSFFTDVKIEEIQKFFIPVREYKSGERRIVIPLCEGEYVEGLLEDITPCKIYDKLFPGYDSRNLSEEMFRNEYDHNNKLIYNQFLPITISDEILLWEYNIDPQSYYVIRYWPIYILTFSYKNKAYYIKNFGTLPENTLCSNFIGKYSEKPKPSYNFLKNTSIGIIIHNFPIILGLCSFAIFIIGIVKDAFSNMGFGGILILVLLASFGSGILFSLVTFILLIPVKAFFKRIVVLLESLIMICLYASKMILYKYKQKTILEKGKSALFIKK